MSTNSSNMIKRIHLPGIVGRVCLGPEIQLAICITSRSQLKEERRFKASDRLMNLLIYSLGHCGLPWMKLLVLILSPSSGVIRITVRLDSLEFLRVPFSQMNVLAAIQHCMKDNLEVLTDQICFRYLDYTLVLSGDISKFDVPRCTRSSMASYVS